MHVLITKTKVEIFKIRIDMQNRFFLPQYRGIFKSKKNVIAFVNKHNCHSKQHYDLEFKERLYPTP